MRLPSRAKDAISEHTGLCRMSRIRVVSARTAETEPGQRFGYSFTNQDQNGHVLAQEKTRVWSYVYQSRRCAQKKGANNGSQTSAAQTHSFKGAILFSPTWLPSKS